jgi:hypothetical protein
MALDPALSDAVRQAASEAGHSEAVAKRLLAWLTQLSDGDLPREANAQFYDKVRQAIAMQGAADED